MEMENASSATHLALLAQQVTFKAALLAYKTHFLHMMEVVGAASVMHPVLPKELVAH